MTEPSADRDGPTPGPGPHRPAGTPGWVRVLGILVLLLVLLVAVLHLTGNSPGGPGSHLGLAAAPTVAQDLVPGAASPC